MLEFLLKYSPVVFKEGELAFRNLPSLLTIVVSVALLFVALWLFYKKTTIQINQMLKGIFIGLKFVAISLLLVALLEPIVTVSTIVPRKSSLVVLVDDSKSMTITDAVKKLSRSGFSKQLLGNQENPGLIADLEKNFKVQMYKFASNVEYIGQTDKISADGVATHLAQSLRFAEEVANQSPVSGVVIVTDGANNSVADPLEAAATLKNRNLPVYVVGVGSENAKDIEVSKIAANHSVIENSVVEISSLIKNSNFENEEIELELREEGRLIKKQTEIL
ncbi:VWA domain-containing protein, partial [bacterium]|nr:VWA domain-containing protein [bacterium]